MNTRFDRLSLLETFVRIAERGSLSEAARDLDVSQPSVSRQLMALEVRLGATLIRRTTHSLSLTSDGIRLLGDARRLLAEWESLEERGSAREGLSGTIRVIAPVALGQGLLVGAATAFLREHPRITIDWRLTDEPIRFAEEGCDCWVKIGPVPDDTLIVRELGQAERLIVGTPDCIGGTTEGDVEALPWLTLGPFEGNRIDLFDFKGRTRTLSVKPRMASDNIVALRKALLSGIGVAIMPRWFIADELASGALIDAAPDWRATHLPVNLALAAGVNRPARVSRFVEVLEQHVAEALAPQDWNPAPERVI